MYKNICESGFFRAKTNVLVCSWVDSVALILIFTLIKQLLFAVLSGL